MQFCMFFISLWDEQGNEAFFPGYCRQAVRMEVGVESMRNDGPLVWQAAGAGTQKITTAKLHQYMYGPELMVVRLDFPILPLSPGDNLTFISRSIEITADAGVIKVLPRNAAVLIRTFDEFMAEHPDATAQQIWDEAFVAGHETAYTLLQGEIPSE